MGAKSGLFYHGTSHHRIESIKKEGLVPHKNGYNGKTGVWLTRCIDTALFFGDVVFQVEIPHDWIKEWDVDGYRIQRLIPPEAIVAVIGEGNGD